MTSVSIHKDQIREHLQEIDDAISIGIERRPATIALHASACSISLLEAYLHKLGKIGAGTIIKHEWFKRPLPEQKTSPLAERKLGADFPAKEDILAIMYTIEENRNRLIYGKPTKEAVKEVHTSFMRLYSIIKEKMHEMGEEIE